MELYTKLVGVSFGNAQKYIPYLKAGMLLTAVREPENPYDSNAIAIFYDFKHLGYIDRGTAEMLAPIEKIKIVVDEITGGQGRRRYYGVNVEIQFLE